MNVRILLKPVGETWVDVILPHGVVLAGLVSVLKMEGYIVAENAVIPKDSIFLILATNTVPTKPNITVFPGGNDSA